MKFDEALKTLRDQANKGAVTWYGPQFEKSIRTMGHLEYGIVEMILGQLQKEYELNQSNCNFCENGYPSMKYQQFKFCPHCGRKLRE